MGSTASKVSKTTIKNAAQSAKAADVAKTYQSIPKQTPQRQEQQIEEANKHLFENLSRVKFNIKTKEAQNPSDTVLISGPEQTLINRAERAKDGSQQMNITELHQKLAQGQLPSLQRYINIYETTGGSRDGIYASWKGALNQQKMMDKDEEIEHLKDQLHKRDFVRNHREPLFKGQE